MPPINRASLQRRQSRTRGAWTLGLFTAAGLSLASSAFAGTSFTDPVGDFLVKTYNDPTTGAARQHNADLDAVGGSVTFKDGVFTLNATLAGTVGDTKVGGVPIVSYVWGMNHGTGTDVLNDGAPNHIPGVDVHPLIDETIIVKANGQMFYQLAKAQDGSNTPQLPILYNAGVVTISDDGHTISGMIALNDILAVFNSPGFDNPLDYTFTLWPKFGQGGNDRIADFGETITAASVPEPASWAMLIAGFGMAGGMLRRRRAVLRTA